MNTNLVLLIIVSTNWMNIAGDWKRESGTNYVKQRLLVTTNTWLVETKICVTSNLVRHVQSTNGPVKWEAVGPLAFPPLSGTKE